MTSPPLCAIGAFSRWHLPWKAEGFTSRLRLWDSDQFGKEDNARFREILRAARCEVLLTAFQAPNMNAFAERFVRSIKSECLSKMIFVSEGILRRALREFVAHYHGERSHQGRGNEIIAPDKDPMPAEGPVLRRERLGGLLSYYHRRAG